MPRVLLLLPTTTYRTEAFVGAATRMGVDVTVASEQPNTLTRLNPAGLLTLDFKDPQKAAQRVVEFSTSHKIDAVVPVDSQIVVVGAAISEALGLRHNSVESATAAQDKHRMRQRFSQAGVPSPQFRLCSLDEDRNALARPSQTAVDYQFADRIGRIGFINPVTQPFCANCNRLRITAEGKIRNCLFSTEEWDVRELLRGGGTDDEIAETVRRAVHAKKSGHGIDTDDFIKPERAMYQVGG